MPARCTVHAAVPRPAHVPVRRASRLGRGSDPWVCLDQFPHAKAKTGVCTKAVQTTCAPQATAPRATTKVTSPPPPLSETTLGPEHTAYQSRRCRVSPPRGRAPV